MGQTSTKDQRENIVKTKEDALSEDENKEKKDALLEDEKEVIYIRDDMPLQIENLVSFRIYYSKKWQKVFYLLGEAHDIKHNCLMSYLSGKEFFDFLTSSTDRLLDIFLEYAYDPVNKIKFNLIHKDKTVSSTLDAIQKNLQECYRNQDKSYQCKKLFNHSRIHLADIRFARSNIKIMEYLRSIAFFCEFSENSQTRILYIENIEVIGPMFPDVKSIEDALGDALFKTKVTKQLDNIPEKYRIVKDLLNNLHKKTKELIPDITYDNMRQFLPFIKKESIQGDVWKEKMEAIKKKIHNAFFILVFMMDIYLFARCFRTFKDEEGHKFHGEPKNIIMVCGNGHISNYKQWLEQTNEFDLVYESLSSKKEACLDISNLEKLIFIK